jgi:hypothetical protein
MILVPPAGDIFNFIDDLQSYPGNIFAFATTFGLFLIRKRRAKNGILPTEFRAWNTAIVFSLVSNVFIVAMPWYPALGGDLGGDGNFWYATYCVTGIGM